MSRIIREIIKRLEALEKRLPDTKHQESAIDAEAFIKKLGLWCEVTLKVGLTAFIIMVLFAIGKSFILSVGAI